MLLNNQCTTEEVKEEIKKYPATNYKKHKHMAAKQYAIKQPMDH